MLSKKVILYGLFELFFWLKETELLHKKSHYGPIFLLDYYFPVLEEIKSPLNGFLKKKK